MSLVTAGCWGCAGVARGTEAWLRSSLVRCACMRRALLLCASRRRKQNLMMLGSLALLWLDLALMNTTCR